MYNVHNVYDLYVYNVYCFLLPSRTQSLLTGEVFRNRFWEAVNDAVKTL